MVKYCLLREYSEAYRGSKEPSRPIVVGFLSKDLLVKYNTIREYSEAIREVKRRSRPVVFRPIGLGY